MKEIKLTKGKVALVDDEDYERVMAFGKWYFGGRYAQKTAYIGMVNGKRTYKTLLMHRFIAGDPYKKEVDHRDENKLNNKKSNLRVCIRSQNKHNVGKFKNNTSGFKGVCWHKRDKKWVAQLMNNKKAIALGYFICPIEAARAYNAAAILHHGEFARLNEIPI